MSLKRYLTVCYVITFVMLLLAGVILSSSDPDASFLGMLIIAPIIAAVNTFIQIWPFARSVPEDQRNGFWSYKWTSLIFIALPSSILLIAILAFIWDEIVGI